MQNKRILGHMKKKLPIFENKKKALTLRYMCILHVIDKLNINV